MEPLWSLVKVSMELVYLHIVFTLISAHTHCTSNISTEVPCDLWPAYISSEVDYHTTCGVFITTPFRSAEASIAALQANRDLSNIPISNEGILLRVTVFLHGQLW